MLRGALQFVTRNRMAIYAAQSDILQEQLETFMLTQLTEQHRHTLIPLLLHPFYVILIL